MAWDDNTFTHDLNVIWYSVQTEHGCYSAIRDYLQKSLVFMIFIRKKPVLWILRKNFRSLENILTTRAKAVVGWRLYLLLLPPVVHTPIFPFLRHYKIPPPPSFPARAPSSHRPCGSSAGGALCIPFEGSDAVCVEMCVIEWCILCVWWFLSSDWFPSRRRFRHQCAEIWRESSRLPCSSLLLLELDRRFSYSIVFRGDFVGMILSVIGGGRRLLR